MKTIEEGSTSEHIDKIFIGEQFEYLILNAMKKESELAGRKIVRKGTIVNHLKNNLIKWNDLTPIREKKEVTNVESYLSVLYRKGFLSRPSKGRYMLTSEGLNYYNELVELLAPEFEFDFPTCCTSDNVNEIIQKIAEHSFSYNDLTNLILDTDDMKSLAAEVYFLNQTV